MRLVVVPGLGLGPEAWAPSLDRLPSLPREVVPLPGYGLPGNGADLHPRALASTVLEAVGNRTVVLAGHSASCQVVAHAAAIAPDRVAGLVLVGPTTDPRAASWPALAQRWLRTAAHETPRQVPSLVRQYARTTLRSMLAAMEQARGDRIDRALGATSVPVLVLRGRHDRICPEDWARCLAGLSPSGVVETLPAGGHMVPLTHGALVAPVVAEFALLLDG